MGNNQTYDNYFKDYYKTPTGRIAKRKAQNKYRARLREERAENDPSYNTKWMRERRLKRREEGLCTICGARPSLEGKVLCEVCVDRNKRNKLKAKERDSNV